MIGAVTLPGTFGFEWKIAVSGHLDLDLYRKMQIREMDA